MSEHITVLLNECVLTLDIKADGVIVDATLGSGGHAAAAIKQLGENGVFIGIDIDPAAVEAARSKFDSVVPTTHFIQGDFIDLPIHLKKLELYRVNGIMADLGWRIEQFQQSGKGFSFLSDEPLIMTLGEPEQYLFTAADVVNDWDEEDIANVIYAYGEERAARRIAKAIVQSRRDTPIETASQLANIIKAAVATKGAGRIHPATKTFQALRIVVNDELKKLEVFISQAFSLLEPQGRLAIITFHSLEDRIVKHTFRSFKDEGTGNLITKKPIVPTPEERASNRRARSAKLRVIEKV